MAEQVPVHSAPDRGLPQATRREFLVGGALLSTALFAAGVGQHAANSVRDTPAPALDDLVPRSFAGWTEAPFADVLIPQAEKAEERSYDEVLTRYYDSRAETPVMLLIAYGKAQSGDTELHRPEACYPVAGFALQRRPDVALRFPGVDVAARSMTAVATDRTEQLLYWTRVGRDFPTSSLAQRISAIRQTFAGSVPDGVLVRMSALSRDRAAAVDTLERFASEMLRGGSPALRQLLTGRA